MSTGSPDGRRSAGVGNPAFASGSGFCYIRTMKEIIAILLAFGVGALCGRFQIPLPAPPHWIGVLLIAATWLGYTLFKQPA